MPTGSSRPVFDRTTSPLLCSPRLREGFCSPRCNGVPVRSIPQSNLLLALAVGQMSPRGGFTAIAEIGSRLSRGFEAGSDPDAGVLIPGGLSRAPTCQLAVTTA